MNRSKFPTRVTTVEIEKNSSKFKAYAVLPVPEYAQKIQFDTIGVTTFKKYIIRSYEKLLAQKAFTIPDCWDIPFVISAEAKVPRVVNISQGNQAQAQTPSKQQVVTQSMPLNIIQQPFTKLPTQLQNKPPSSPQIQQSQMNPSMDFTQDVGSYYALPHRKQIWFGFRKKTFSKLCLFFCR